MGTLDGRVAIITGAGGGIGREHALLFAAEGANVVVNDVGGATDGSGGDGGAAQGVVDEIRASGGAAVANTDSVSNWEGAQRLINTAIETFGDLHAVVNNAGILRDRVLVNMTEDEFDAVVDVHLKGTFAVSRWAAAYWREQTKAGVSGDRTIVNTSSGSGLHGNPGQTNYGAAKAGIASMSLIAAMELQRYGVRVNAIAPIARTRMTLQTPGISDAVAAPSDPSTFDVFDPGNVSPLVAYLSTAGCPFNGQVFSVVGSSVGIYQGWSIAEEVTNDNDRWTVPELATAMDKLPRQVKANTQGASLAQASR
jgi:NAD(P)-dependent dehydrogenase (short-subunit alcohol dehydrogenase family)